MIPKPKATLQGLQRKALCGAQPRAEPGLVGRLPQSCWVSTGGIVLPELLNVSTYSHILPCFSKGQSATLIAPYLPFCIYNVTWRSFHGTPQIPVCLSSPLSTHTSHGIFCRMK